MYKVEGTTITLTRGDTFYAQITIKRKDGTVYTPQEGDTIRFALKSPRMTSDKKDFIEKEPLILKTIPTETMTLQLDPSDTKNLGFGKYKYDIELTFYDGKVNTFIADADLILTTEVH